MKAIAARRGTPRAGGTARRGVAGVASRRLRELARPAAPAAGARPAARGAAAAVDPETRLSGDHHESLRLWLRLLTCTLLIERGIRARLREAFATTLPRFDLMAQLERNPGGLRMGELSRRLMVTGGNVTGITDQLVAEGLVERRPIAHDRRAQAVRLTPKGKRAFDTMAVAHERWVIELLAGLDTGERRRLAALLGRLKTTVAAAESAAGGEAEEVTR
jgi:DNA-binding MarR family transcriptional regulator